MIGKRNRSIPWDEIKKAFVEGKINDAGNRYYPTITQLCEQYKIAKSSIGTRCSKEQWAEQREILANKIETITNEKTIEAISDAGSSFDLKCFNASNALLDVCAEKAQAANRGSDVDDMKKLADTMKALQIVGRMALGLSTENIKSTNQVSVRGEVTRMDEEA